MRHKLLIIILATLVVLSSLPTPMAYAGNTYTIANAGDTVVFDIAAKGVQNGDRIIVKSGAKAYIIGQPDITYNNVQIHCEAGMGSEVTLRNVNITSNMAMVPLFIDNSSHLFKLTLMGENHISNITNYTPALSHSPLMINGHGSLYLDSGGPSSLVAGSNLTIASESHVHSMDRIEISNSSPSPQLSVHGKLYVSGETEVIEYPNVVFEAGSYVALGKNIIDGTLTSSSVFCTLDLSTGSAPVPVGTKVYLYDDGKFVTEAVIQEEGKLYTYLPQNSSIHLTMDEGTKSTEVFVADMDKTVTRSFNDVTPPSPMTIDISGTVLSGGNPITNKDAILRTSAKVAPLDIAGEYLYSNVNLFEHNFIVAGKPAVIKFVIGDSLCMTQTGHRVTITVTESMSNVDLTWDLTASRLVLVNATKYLPSDNPDTGDR